MSFFLKSSLHKIRWYQEPWMWLVIGGPVIVIVAALYTAKLAYFGADKVVAENYYKQGLMINQDLRKDAVAHQKKLKLQAQFNPTRSELTIFIEGEGALPSALSLSIAQSETSFSVHEMLRKMVLPQITPGIYRGTTEFKFIEKNTHPVRWHLKVEADDWRLVGDWLDPLHTILYLSAGQ